MPSNIHDRGYKGILQKPNNFLDLLKGFIHEKWVSKVKPGELMLINKEFILPDFTSREADIVYRCVLDSQEIIFYVLLEIQSSVDNSMPIRLLSYMTEIIRQSFLQTDRNVRLSAGYRAPAVVPVVIYNGDSKWTPPLNFRDYQNKSKLFGNNTIDFTYILLSTQSFHEDELGEIGSLISIVFMLDRHNDHDYERAIGRYVKARKLFSKLTNEQQYELLSWMKNILRNTPGIDRRPGLADKIVQTFERGGEDMESGLETCFEQAINEGKEQGIELGKEQGIELGKEQIIKMLLKNLLADGFSYEKMASLVSLSVDEVKKFLNE